MSPNKNQEHREDGIRCAISLCAAVQQSGGDVEAVGKHLAAMTAMEFMSTILAQNNIRFVFHSPKCPLDTDGDGNCPIHTNCSTGERRRP